MTIDIKKWLLNQYKSKKISVISYDEMAGKIRQVTRVVSDMDRKYVSLEARLDERETIERIIDKKLAEVKVAPSAPGKKTFAEAAAVPRITGFKKVVPSPKILMIQSKEGEKEPEEIKKLMKEAINPGA